MGGNSYWTPFVLFATAGLSLGSSFSCFPFFPFGMAAELPAAGGVLSLSFADASSCGDSDGTGGMSVVKGTVAGCGNLSVSLMPGPFEERDPSLACRAG